VSGEALKAFAPFADLSEAERTELGDLLEERHLSPDETLFVEGDDAEAVVLIVDGALRISSARTPESASFGGGTVLGGFALFTVGTRETTAVAAERSRILQLRREEFLRLAEDSPRTAYRVATALAAELAAQTRQGIGALAAGSVDPAPAGE
jgi:CRP-like cAMP-binding protein